MGKAIIQPAGNFYDKYRTRNPVARWLMSGFLNSFDTLRSLATGVRDALEIGCGEGELTMRVAREGIAIQGCDIAPEAIDEARKRAAGAAMAIPFSVCDIAAARERFEPCDLVICCEVMEHLDDPPSALEILDALSTRYVLLSVPREPIWRILNLARMRYIGSLGNTPGHVQHWSRRRFIRLLETRFDIVSVRTPLPWTMALCRVRR